MKTRNFYTSYIKLARQGVFTTLVVKTIGQKSLTPFYFLEVRRVNHTQPKFKPFTP